MEKSDEFGGFVVTKNVLRGVPVKFSFRKQSSVKQLNGWNLLSEKDNDEYIRCPENFMITKAEALKEIAPDIFEIFDAPYGTSLLWVYENKVHTGYYDLNKDCDITVEEILKKQSFA